MLDTAWVSGNFFQTLGVRPHIGRVLTMEDDQLGTTNPVVVLQYDFWRNRFGARPEVVGSTIDRKSTGLNSSHANISYAVFCLKKKSAGAVGRVAATVVRAGSARVGVTGVVLIVPERDGHVEREREESGRQ